MLSVELIEQKTESEDVSSFTFEVRALPEPEQKAQVICDKIGTVLLEAYGVNEKFAVDVGLVGFNSIRQTLVVEIRIKDETLNSIVVADLISKSLKSLY